MFQRIASSQIYTQMNLYCYQTLDKDAAFLGRLTINQIERNNYF